jgi:hypothetical protein
MLGVVVSSVEIEWHGGHSAARCFTLNCYRFMLDCLTRDQVGPLGGK